VPRKINSPSRIKHRLQRRSIFMCGRWDATMRHSRRKELDAGLSAERLHLNVGVSRLVSKPGTFHRQKGLILPRHRRPMKSRRPGTSGRPFVHHHSVSRGHNEPMLSPGVGHTMSDAKNPPSGIFGPALSFFCQVPNFRGPHWGAWGPVGTSRRGMDICFLAQAGWTVVLDKSGCFLKGPSKGL